MDVDALEIARGNIELVDMDDEITLVNAQLPSREPGEPVPNGIDDAIPILDPTKLDRKIDTVIMNPPFGTWNKVSLCISFRWVVQKTDASNKGNRHGISRSCGGGDLPFSRLARR